MNSRTTFPYSIRRSVPADLDTLMHLFEQARQKMRTADNSLQWPATYPSAELLVNDIERGQSYVVEAAGQVVATFVLAFGNDPTYAQIEGGAWLDAHRPYATIHRLASAHGVHGIAASVIAWCKTQIDNLRADTHRDNRQMQHLLLSHGFTYCGIIHLANGEERLAYQQVSPVR